MRVAIYCRVSTEMQCNDNQKQICLDHCSRMGFDVFKIYDDVYSGKYSQRPEFNKLLSDMRSNKFDAIMVTKLDRLGRSLQHLLDLVEEFSKRGLHFIVSTQNIDTTTSSGRLQFQIMGAFAEFERNIISERTKESRLGKLNWGKRGKDKKPRQKRGVQKSVKFDIEPIRN